MRSEQFRQWVLARGVSAASARTRAYALERVEQVLGDLGFPYADLDAE